MTPSDLQLENFQPLTGRRTGCFGCGTDNAAGLQMRFFADDRRVVSRLVVPKHFCGWGNLVHGGIISTLLDEIMGWTAIHFLRRVVLTKSLQVDFLKPVFAGDLLWVEGSIFEQCSEREVRLQGKVLDSTGRLCAEGLALFALFTPEAARELGFLDPDLIEEVAAHFLND